MEEATKEVLRYLGYGKKEADEVVLQLIAESMEELLRVAVRKQIHVELPLTLCEEGHIFIGSMKIKSKHLAKNLENCQRVIVFSATLGVGVDGLIRRTSHINMAKTVVLQACAATVIEAYCDQVQGQMEQEYRQKGLFLRPRFSPGYGDFSILHQKDILDLLQSSKTIGVHLTDGLMLVPTKSITAIIGISDENKICHKKGCQECLKIDCAFRRS